MIEKKSIPVECTLSTTDQSRSMDSQTIREFGIDGFTLMELAASSAARHMMHLQGNSKHGLFICGKGNNSGDALAAARYLTNEANHNVTLFFVLGEDDLSPDAEKNLSLLHKLKEFGATIEFIDTLQDINEQKFDYLVDGIFGTGLNSKLRGELPSIVEQINSFSIPVYSMDIPSGLHADTGEVLGGCIQSDYTFTFGSNKIGLHWKEAKKYCGKIVFCNLPFPAHYRDWEAVLINQTLLNSVPAVKRSARHKYDGGVVHIMAGSEGLTGAAIMAAKSAWKQGAGAVFLYAPKALLPVYESNLTNIIKIGLGHSSDTYFKESHADLIKEKMNDKNGVLLAGPGMGTHKETGNCLISVMKEHDGPAILDADALSFWDSLHSSESMRDQKKRWILTPHIGEAKKYLQAKFTSDFDRFEWAKEFSDSHNLSLLIKGNPTMLCFTGSENFITGYDTSIFSRAGFGDVLSGALAAAISISNSQEIAAINVLYSAYEESLKKVLKNKNTFGPEDLI